MSTTNAQSATDTGKNALESATRQNNWFFAAYMILLALVLIFTYLLWRSGNNVQDAIRANADARIAEANALAKTAIAAAERARADQEQLRNDNLKLEARLRETENTNLLAQQRINQLEEGRKPRTISDTQREKISELLKPFAGQEVQIGIVARETEAQQFSTQVENILRDAGLKVNLVNFISASAEGFGVAVHDKTSAPPLAGAIQYAFRSAGIDTIGTVEPTFVHEGKFMVFIGAKPLVRKSN